MQRSINSVSTFLQATNTLMNSARILPVPVALNGVSLTYGRIGPRIECPESMIFLGTRVPCDEFVSFLPVVARPSEVDLDLRVTERDRAFISQWWRLQEFVNKSLPDMKQRERPRQRALELRREGEEAEKLGGGEDAAWAFFESAVILRGLGRPRDAIAGELLGSARNFEAASLHTSAAIAYELTFRSDPSDRSLAMKASEQWLESVRKEFDPEALKFRVNRALIFAAYSPYESMFRDAARESGRMNAAAGRHFDAGADYFRAAWSMIQRGTPGVSGWADISVYMETAADMFRHHGDVDVASEVGALAALAAEFAQRLMVNS
ncbi:MAG: hypothetical protein JXA24_06180 [Proteobacteria bacterium]|nr:hypothetical protein [Pseudomonadota bacterium]